VSKKINNYITIFPTHPPRTILKTITTLNKYFDYNYFNFIITSNTTVRTVHRTVRRSVLEEKKCSRNKNLEKKYLEELLLQLKSKKIILEIKSQFFQTDWSDLHKKNKVKLIIYCIRRKLTYGRGCVKRFDNSMLNYCLTHMA
jgi:hypothetical protein